MHKAENWREGFQHVSERYSVYSWLIVYRTYFLTVLSQDVGEQKRSFSADEVC